LLAGEGVELRRWLQTAREPTPLDLEVLPGVVVFLTLVFVPGISFVIAVASVAITFVPATGSATPS
jgi:hypothetical protein